MVYAASFAFLAAGVLIRLIPAAEIPISDGHVRLADVAEAPSPSIGAIEIARLPIGTTRTIARARLAGLIERAVPGAEISGDLKGTVALRSTSVPPVAISLPYSPDAPAAERGQKLMLVSTVGPVVIQRPVVAAQSAAKSDKRLFVRTDDGEVISIPLSAGAAK